MFSVTHFFSTTKLTLRKRHESESYLFNMYSYSVVTDVSQCIANKSFIYLLNVSKIKLN